MSTIKNWSPEEESFIKKALATIPKTPEERITDNVSKVRERKNYIYDVHVHAFDKKSINEAYFIFQFIRDSMRRDTKALFDEGFDDQELAVQRLLKETGASDIEDFYEGHEIPDWDEIEKIISSAESLDAIEEQKAMLGVESYSEFFWFVLRKFFKSKTQGEMLNFYFEDYSINKKVDKFKQKEMIVCLLMMDFHEEFGGKKPNKSMWYQVNEINELADKKNGHPILPFLALDPRRVEEEGNENLYNLFLKAFDREQGGRFFGVKLYPALGYSPSDPRLAPFYEVCEKLNIPVVSHCGGEMVSTFEDKILVYNDFDPSKKVAVERNTNVPGNARRQRIFNLNDPSKFIPVLKEFTKLKLNIAHFGSNEAWINKKENSEYANRIETITKLIDQYDGVYTDFSFCVSDHNTYKKLSETLKNKDYFKILDRLMYGTDYWVVLFTEHDKFAECLKQFSKHILDDQKVMLQMLTNNPENYLFKEVFKS